mmetsp:Transcript_13506/g.20090  ORF Transcript_13506/g.20090 Transcript_13506/m.20090 type:complete len:247 (+) Transcript_13506:146-886(+)|eukprot:CAMPEP_0194084600 /NCGR_PEP_ID=MMETSP0149-20130528/13942_1 /TAXON_ID=122233 /ORGANISM="Chaetoceros debilis, Strain MM31A-1" /LENGTH=246 /DNA_ID=CAMNT_0038767291 /DNA_START=77 /DNA_END=817 /DNA_ORIENTATION=-
MNFLASSIHTTSSSGKSVAPLILTGAAAGLCTYIATKKLITRNDKHSVNVHLPEWAKTEFDEFFSQKKYTNDEEMMELAVHLSARNVAENTGGPFGCAIFERDFENNTSELVSIGINRVVPLSNSTLHGETVAIQLAQSNLKSFTMQIPNKSGKIRKFELFTSCEPCAMCLGATLWSGVSRIVCAATKADAERIGFNEGPVFAESYKQLEEAGIQVTKLVLQKEAAAVLADYGKKGVIYNSSGSSL